MCDPWFINGYICHAYHIFHVVLELLHRATPAPPIHRYTLPGPSFDQNKVLVLPVDIFSRSGRKK